MNIKKYGLVLAVLIMTLSSLTAFSSEPVKLGNETLDATKLPLVSARVLGKDLYVIYNIPKGQHATIMADMNFMTVEVTKVKGLTFGKTVYPTGKKDKEGDTEYHGVVVLRIPFTIGKDFDYNTKSIAFEAGYQFCLDTGSCMPPDSVKATATLNLTKLAVKEAVKPVIKEIIIPEVKDLTKDFEEFAEKVKVTEQAKAVEKTLKEEVTPEVKVKAEEVAKETAVIEVTKEEKKEVATTGELDLGFDYVITDKVKEKADFLTILKYLVFAFIGGLILNIMPCVLPVLSIKAMSIVNSAHKDKKEIFKGSMAYTAGILSSFMVLAVLAAIAKSAGESAGWGTQMQNFGFVFTLFIIIWVFSLSLFDVFIIQLPGMQAANKASHKKGHMGSFMSGIFAVLLATPCTAPMLAPAVAFLMNLDIPYIFVTFFMIGLGLAFPFILLGVSPKAMKYIPKPGNWMNTFKELMGFLLIATALFLAYILEKMLGDNFFNLILFLIPLSLSCWMYGKFAGPGKSTSKQWLYTILALIISIGSGYFLIEKPQPMAAEVRDEMVDNWYRFSPEQMSRAKAENKPVLIDSDSSFEKGKGSISIEEKDGSLVITSTEKVFGRTKKIKRSDIVIMRDDAVWKPFSREKLKKTLEVDKKAVFIDFGAAWCATCHANERAVLYTESMLDEFKKRDITLMKADYTNKSKEMTDFIANFGGAGVPFYLMFVPGKPVKVVTFPTTLTSNSDVVDKLGIVK